ncbi:hypothetical protein [Rhodoflexus sp.]
MKSTAATCWIVSPRLDKEEFNCRCFLYTWGLGLFVAAGFLMTAMGWCAFYNDRFITTIM